MTTDTIGVPTGGQYGDIRRWEPVLNRHGMKLMWSRFHQTFMVYTDFNPARPVCQVILLNKETRRPIPVTGRLVNLLVWLRETHAREGGAVGLVEAMEEVRARRAREQYEELNRDRDRRMREMEREVPKDMGVRDRMVISDLGPAYAAAQMKRARRRKRNLAMRN